MQRVIKWFTPIRIIALGFIAVILIGSLLLSLPCSLREGIELPYIDALYMSTSAVCVTGLSTVDAGSTFSPLGQFFLGLLMQIGGLGVTVVGAGAILLIGKKIDLKGRNAVREAMNLGAGRSVIRFVRGVLLMTLVIETVGAIASFFVFIKDFPLPRAIGISLFHSVAAFNNSGFDILGNGNSLAMYESNVALNIITAVLIILGGIGFLVIRELIARRFHPKKLSMHTKIVLTVSLVLIASGTLLLKLTDNISWLTAFFTSVSTRTAGFATFSMGELSNAGMIVVMLLMVIGASPGSTGGGIKTTTVFVLLYGLVASATNRSEKAFNYSIPKNAFRKACVILLLAFSVIAVSSFSICVIEPSLDLRDVLFEMSSAMGTVGLSTGITPGLATGSKIISMLVMYVGRLGPLTVASLWYFSKVERVRYPDGNIAIG